jgi:hypothetical protein
MIVSATRSASCSYLVSWFVDRELPLQSQPSPFALLISPVGPGRAPQAHLRCSNPVPTGKMILFAAGFTVFTIGFMDCVLRESR